MIRFQNTRNWKRTIHINKYNLATTENGVSKRHATIGLRPDGKWQQENVT